MSRPHENDMKIENALQSANGFENATVSASCGRIEFTENANFHLKIPRWRISTENVYFFIGISLLLSLIMNWQLNVYAHINLNNIFYTYTVDGFQSFSSFPCGRVKRSENDRVDAILSLRFQWNENENFWKRIRVDGASTALLYVNWHLSILQQETFTMAEIIRAVLKPLYSSIFVLQPAKKTLQNSWHSLSCHFPSHATESNLFN